MHTIPSLDELIELITHTLKEWHASEPSTMPAIDLSFLQRAATRHGTSLREEVKALVLRAMATLSHTFPDDVSLLKERFIKRRTAEALANELGWSDAAFYRKQKNAQIHLAQQVERLLQEEEQTFRERLEARLEPVTYRNLFGVTETLTTLEQVLIHPGEPWIITITGIGGIGKTTLADACLRRAIAGQWYDEIGWATARQMALTFTGELHTVWQDKQTDHALEQLGYTLAKQLFGETEPALLQQPWPQIAACLKTHLKRVPHLIVLDNLETVAATDQLLLLLREWVNPTKFLLTSRKTLHEAADVYHITASQLTETDALRLVRQEAMTRNLPHVVTASDNELRPIYEVVGGNPLALRLVTGQLHLDPLPKVLHDLKEASGYEAQALYTYIYQRAWELINENERLTLLAMPMLDPQGGSFDTLTSICQRVPKREVDKALKKLISLSLVDCRVSLYESRYSIHSLTRSFLHKQIVQWSGADDVEE